VPKSSYKISSGESKKNRKGEIKREGERKVPVVDAIPENN
jgi:hypothetical protein